MISGLAQVRDIFIAAVSAAGFERSESGPMR
jgi:hypothetical protein